jgi:hypothetical protein
VIDVILALDIIVNFRTGYLDKKTMMIESRTRPIAVSYLKGWFAFDLLATLPWTYVFPDYQFLKLSRILKINSLGIRISNSFNLIGMMGRRAAGHMWCFTQCLHNTVRHTHTHMHTLLGPIRQPFCVSSQSAGRT